MNMLYNSRHPIQIIYHVAEERGVGEAPMSTNVEVVEEARTH